MMGKMISKMTAVDAARFLGVTVQSVHKKLKQKDLGSQKSQNRVFFGHETAKNIFEISFKKKVVAFQIVKGGTGKTSLAHSFAVRASLYGAKVLCIDLDQQGNLTRAFNCNSDELPVMIDLIANNMSPEDCIVEVDDGIDLLPSRIENATLDNFIMLNKHPLDRIYSKIINKVQKKYDLIIFDCPPAIGQSVAAATLASDVVISPLTPEQFSLSGLKITFDEMKSLSKKFEKEIDVKIVLNKFDNRNALSSEVLSKILNDESISNSLCKSFIRICQEFPNTVYSSKNIFETLKNTAAREDVDLFTCEILEIERNGEEAA